MSYQDRVDIDKLYGIVWDFDSNQPLLLTKEEFELFKGTLSDEYYDKVTTDELLADYLHNSTATGKTDYTIDQLLNEKSDSTHTHNWVEIDTVESDCQLFVNEKIKCAELVFSVDSVDVDGSYITLLSISEIEDYPPMATLHSTSFRPEIMVQLETDGTVKTRASITKTDITISGNFFWHYDSPLDE